MHRKTWQRECNCSRRNASSYAIGDIQNKEYLDKIIETASEISNNDKEQCDTDEETLLEGWIEGGLKRR